MQQANFIYCLYISTGELPAFLIYIFPKQSLPSLNLGEMVAGRYGCNEAEQYVGDFSLMALGMYYQWLWLAHMVKEATLMLPLSLQKGKQSHLLLFGAFS